ncbi:MAG: asparagine synthase (glutamine-hydrolyzing) [Bryobacteraceae bacterium]|nr:asparagine synthase (glutamine-hydrolyzing) [Bryobacteraceae bacterium]
MCGIAGQFGTVSSDRNVRAMLHVQRHRGPDDTGIWTSPSGRAAMGQNRLSILDLSAAGHQPMPSASGRYHVVFNGEIYNYLELRAQLPDYPFRSQSDTEVLLAAWERWGEASLDRFIGMFAFLLWDEREQSLTAVRDRFGVKPLYYSKLSNSLFVASEIRALHEAGVDRTPNVEAWANHLVLGATESDNGTFWRHVQPLPPGHLMRWSNGHLSIRRWYDISDASGSEYDTRPTEVVLEQYAALMKESVALRFRSDVPVGINLSGGLDSSSLLASVSALQLEESNVAAFTFITGDGRYDELPWVKQMLAATHHPLHECLLSPDEVPALAEEVQSYQDEPYGGLPTLAYANLFRQARSNGTIVLLDGQGMDEQWAGYDYYSAPAASPALVQGAKDRASRPECVSPELQTMATPQPLPDVFPDRLRNLQYRDIRYSKIPRALRFNDRISMMSSTELREPFLDHRLMELALRQPADRKIQGPVRKWGLRQVASNLLPPRVVNAPKRALQTPQREWLRGPLREWAGSQIESATDASQGWLNARVVRSEWNAYLEGQSDNSYYVWQWINLNLCLSVRAGVAHV